MLRPIMVGASCAALLAYTAATPVFAQDESYEPLGIRAGSFLVFPRVRVGLSLDDNVFATEDDEEEDIYVEIEPDVTVSSQWSRHQLDLRAGLETGIYNDFDENDYTDYYFFGDGRVDVTRNTNIEIGARFQHLHDDRSSPDSPQNQNVDLTEYDLYGGTLGLNQTFNRVSVGLEGGYTVFDFDDGGVINNDDRDRDQIDARVRVGYDISPAVNVFVQGEYDNISYDQDDDILGAGRNRDSDGFGGALGAEFDITNLLRGELNVGYTTRDYDDAQLDSVDGLSFGGAVTWEPTRLTSVRVGLDRDVRETTLAGASGNFQTNVGVDVEHELRRNIIIDATLGYTNDDYEGSGRTDDTYRIGAGVTYLITRNFGVEASYLFTDRSSDNNGSDYTRNLVMFGLVGRL